MGKAPLRGVSGGEALLIKLPGGMCTCTAVLQGGENMYITLSELIQTLGLICEVVTVLILALNFFKSNKK